MSPPAQEASLQESFSIIPDPHERLQAIVSSCMGKGIPEADRREEQLVPGCVSSVWLDGSVDGSGVLHLHWDAASPLVRGLAGLICRVYDGTAAKEAAGHETRVLDSLGLTRQISPTRLNGLANLALRIRQLAGHEA